MENERKERREHKDIENELKRNKRWRKNILDRKTDEKDRERMCMKNTFNHTYNYLRRTSDNRPLKELPQYTNYHLINTIRTYECIYAQFLK